MYFKHKKFEIEAGKQRQIDDLFSQYDEAKLGRISAKDARLILREIEIDSMDAARLVAEADQEKRSVIKYEHFLEVLRMYMVCAACLYLPQPTPCPNRRTFNLMDMKRLKMISQKIITRSLFRANDKPKQR